MDITINFEQEVALRIVIAFLIGLAIGIEREYYSKAAGLRTMIMICMGSTIFTLISTSIDSDSKDRIASNIITGIGFLGAGVIFKDNLTISGITTATTIWVCAALGMAVGTGEYFIAFTGSAVVLVVLVLLQRIQKWIEKLHQSRTYKIITLESDNYPIRLEQHLQALQLRFSKKRDMKRGEKNVMLYEVMGREENLDRFNNLLKVEKDVISYEY